MGQPPSIMNSGGSSSGVTISTPTTNPIIPNRMTSSTIQSNQTISSGGMPPTNMDGSLQQQSGQFMPQHQYLCIFFVFVKILKFFR